MFGRLAGVLEVREEKRDLLVEAVDDELVLALEQVDQAFVELAGERRVREVVAEVEGGEAFEEQDPLEHEVSVGRDVELRQEVREVAHEFGEVELGAVDVLDDHVFEDLVQTERGVADLLVDVAQGLAEQRLRRAAR